MSQPANDDYSQHLSDDETSYHEDASDSGAATNKPKQQQQQVTPTTTTISNIKLPILKKEYDIWAMKMEHYLKYIDNDVWKVIQNRNSKKRISTGKDGVVRILPPVSAKMQKAVLKQQFEAFSISSSEGLEKGYDRFQQLLSQLEAHGAEVSTEDANHKFLRSLPSAWSNLAMTMRTKPDVDTLSIDDLYNNLRVFEQELTSTSKSSASAQNVAFVSHSKSSTNKVKSGHTGAYNTYTPTSSNNIQEREVPVGFADEVIYSLFAKQSEDWDLLHEDIEQINDVDIKEMDINWQIAMIAIRMKKFYKKTGRRVRIDGNKPVGFDKKKLECMDKSKITRKQSKASKHGHENQKSTKPKPKIQSLSQFSSTRAILAISEKIESLESKAEVLEASAGHYKKTSRLTHTPSSDMSNSDELRHADNTTLVPSRLPNTLPQVYHGRRPTLGLLIFPSVSPFPPTIRRTARISIPPIEPNLAERAKISAINLDDYQPDPVTPPPSPSSPFTMAAYQRMIAIKTNETIKNATTK
ncbi:hypothetical protein Tco_0801744 [Tanacetum coccineum]|uniref:Uncharacterized protein n=1 Tax=Tanacetum coccineum TaxID=301880 RepID=A0ABQ4ZZQ6_9ASTR